MFPFTRNNRRSQSPTLPQRRPLIASSTPLNSSYESRRSAAIATGKLCKSQAATIIARTERTAK